MPFEDLMDQLALTLERDGSVQAVFGEPIKLEQHTIVPVAVVTGGAGAGGSQGADAGGFAGGAGFGLNVRPVGFIHESGENVIFTPIHLDVRNKPVLTEAAFGVRRAVELASSVVAQFVQRRARKIPIRVIAEEEVSSPS